MVIERKKERRKKEKNSIQSFFRFIENGNTNRKLIEPMNTRLTITRLPIGKLGSTNKTFDNERKETLTHNGIKMNLICVHITMEINRTNVRKLNFSQWFNCSKNKTKKSRKPRLLWLGQFSRIKQENSHSHVTIYTQ